MAPVTRRDLSKVLTSVTDPASGWDARLWRLWALSTALADTVILAVVYGLATVGLNVDKHVELKGNTVAQLAVATLGAVLYGGVLGTLQWRVLRERIAIPRRRWIMACVIPAFISWIVFVVPAAANASSSDGQLRTTYFLALSQAMALGPLLGFSQSTTLRPYTRRWAWWIAANIGSWLVVNLVFFLLSLLFGGFDFAHGKGSPAEAYILLIAAAPLTGRWILWVLAPAALTAPPQAARTATA